MWKHLKSRPDIVFALLLIAFARLIPHPWNLTPIGATGLFAGAHLSPRWSWLIPLAPMVIGDWLIGGYNALVMLFVYLGIAGTAFIGYWFLGHKFSALRAGGAVISASLFFFLVSNFGVWLSGMYAPTWQGLVECYLMGLPYLGNTLIGDSFYAGLFFGLFHLIKQPLHDPTTTI